MAIIARHLTPRGEVVLRRRDADDDPPVLEIIADGVFLMSSLNGGSERALAERCLEPLGHRKKKLRVLVGGLGMGFTLSAVLDHQYVVVVDVIEVEPHVVLWARTHFVHLNDNALTDGRVRIIVADIIDFVATCQDAYDAILLDVDNGPTWLAADTNAALYEAQALERLRSMLEPGGTLGVWSSQRSGVFAEALRRAFAVDSPVDELVIPERVEGRDLEFYLYRAQRHATD